MAATVDLSLLASKCNKDPCSYREDFLVQLRHFDALASVVEMRPGAAHAELAALVTFVGAVAGAFRDDARPAAEWAVRVLSERGVELHPSVRRALVRTLGMCRARGVLRAADTVPVYFKLLRCHDKALRRTLHGMIGGDLKRAAGGGREEQALKSGLLRLASVMMRDSDAVAVKQMLQVFVRLYRKRVWADDARLVNTLAAACFHPSGEVVQKACRFFLDSDRAVFGEDDEDEDDEDDEDGEAHEDEEDDEGENAGGGNGDHGRGAKRSSSGGGIPRKTQLADSVRTQQARRTFKLTSKKSTRKKKQFERAVARERKREARQNAGAALHEAPLSFSAIQLLNDPQEFAERLFAQLRTRHDTFANRLSLIHLVSRLIAVHELIVLAFYPYLQNYMRPSQRDVTQVLAYAAQACHRHVPPDVVEPMLRHLAYEFVSDRRSDEVMAIGLNTIREVCARVPDAMDATLLQDLVQYKRCRDKGVMMSARGLMQLFRDLRPHLLLRRDRGRPQQAQRDGAGAEDGQNADEGGEESERDGEEMEEEEEKEVEMEEEERQQCTDEGELDESSDGCDGSSADEKDDDDDEEDEEEEEEDKRDDDDDDKAKASSLAAAAGVVHHTQLSRPLEPATLESYAKRQRRTLEQRLASVHAGREDRPKYSGDPYRNRKKSGGTSNAEKERAKAGAMLKHKIRTQKRHRRACNGNAAASSSSGGGGVNVKQKGARSGGGGGRANSKKGRRKQGKRR